jgi:hypothetical protein
MIMVRFYANIIFSVFFILITDLKSVAEVSGNSGFDYEEMSGETADQIHFSIISNTAITFDWVGTADHIYYDTDSGALASQVIAVNPDYLPVDSPWVALDRCIHSKLLLQGGQPVSGSVQQAICMRVPRSAWKCSNKSRDWPPTL